MRRRSAWRNIFPVFFDRIVVDAPCSGEGMFRKDEQAVTQWSPENVKMCAERQQSILEQAAEMLRPGGVLVYSTCTFAPEEDEGSMAAFLLRHPEFAVKKVEACESFAPGHPEWAAEVLADVQKEEDRGKGQGRTVEEAAMQIRDTFRLWPHLLEGEGHYLAVLEKSGSRAEQNEEERAGKKAERGRTAGNRFGKDRMGQREKEAIQLYQEFARETLAGQPEGIPVLFGDQLFLLPCELNLAGLKVLRAGLHLGMVKKNRFEPSHALALALRAEDALRAFSYSADSGEIRAYLRGEELQPSGKQGEIQKGQKEERAGKAQKRLGAGTCGWLSSGLGKTGRRNAEKPLSEGTSSFVVRECSAEKGFFSKQCRKKAGKKTRKRPGKQFYGKRNALPD